MDEEGVRDCDRAFVRCDPSSSNKVEASVFAIKMRVYINVDGIK